MEKPKKEMLLLPPRIRVDFMIIEVSTPIHVPGHGHGHDFRSRVHELFKRGVFFGLDVGISESDIVYKDEGDPNPKYIDLDLGPGGSRRCRVVRNGMLYVRDFGFVPKWEKATNLPKSKLREYLRDYVSGYKIRLSNSFTYELRASLPICDVAGEMMNLVAKPKPLSTSHLPINYPCTILLKGVPFQWFVNSDTDTDTDTDHPDSSKPCHHRLLHYFQRYTSGKIRNLETSENDEKTTYCNVAIEYENYPECYKALKRLCSSYLLKVEKGGSITIADYELMWKDPVVPVSPEVHPNISPKVHANKSSCENSEMASQQVPVAPDGEDIVKKFQDLQQEMAVLKEHVRCIEAKLEAVAPDNARNHSGAAKPLITYVRRGKKGNVQQLDPSAQLSHLKISKE